MRFRDVDKMMATNLFLSYQYEYLDFSCALSVFSFICDKIVQLLFFYREVNILYQPYFHFFVSNIVFVPQFLQNIFAILLCLRISMLHFPSCYYIAQIVEF